ncbi:hypothetical protein ASE85_18100 [Sphingobium sp. Leaf26]|uniref:hypothetical protein n=1 Tax=Sphingobium sp. Leaf26 TaxID=1735693 RepID=UPI0006FC3D3A|nr:hypothetical protein [Sphingobium sp. Leaf26]KQN07508.1 hypothetical protein ASE85_18100 [Sphingobium sp. Leaf26]
MRSHLEFRSGALCDPPGTALPGELLARQLVLGLPAHGYRIRTAVAEDWGWCVALENPGFALWIGCGALAACDDGHLCFIHPSKPRVWRWLGRVDASETVERLAGALESCVLRSGVAHHLRWWSEDEVKAGR